MQPQNAPSFDEYVQSGLDMQRALVAAQQELERAVVTGRSDDGSVIMVVNGIGKLQGVKISPAVFARGDAAALEAAVAQAVRNAGANASKLAEQKMGQVEITLH